MKGERGRERIPSKHGGRGNIICSVLDKKIHTIGWHFNESYLLFSVQRENTSTQVIELSAAYQMLHCVAKVNSDFKFEKSAENISMLKWEGSDLVSRAIPFQIAFISIVAKYRSEMWFSRMGNSSQIHFISAQWTKFNWKIDSFLIKAPKRCFFGPRFEKLWWNPVADRNVGKDNPTRHKIYNSELSKLALSKWREHREEKQECLLSIEVHTMCSSTPHLVGFPVAFVH